jgi:hypothetical protein
VCVAVPHVPVRAAAILSCGGTTLPRAAQLLKNLFAAGQYVTSFKRVLRDLDPRLLGLTRLGPTGARRPPLQGAAAAAPPGVADGARRPVCAGGGGQRVHGAQRGAPQGGRARRRRSACCVAAASAGRLRVAVGPVAEERALALQQDRPLNARRTAAARRMRSSPAGRPGDTQSDY